MLPIIQKKNLQNFLPPVFFVGIALLAGSKRFIQYFPDASKNGLLCSATLGSLSVVGSGLTFSKRELEQKRRICVAAGLIISAIITPSLAEKLVGRVDLNFKGSFRFVLAEAIIFGITEATLPFVSRSVIPFSDNEYIGEDYNLSEKSMTALRFIKSNRIIRGGGYIGEEFIAACKSLRTGSTFTQVARLGHGTHCPVFSNPTDFLAFVTNPTQKEDRSNPFFFIIGEYESGENTTAESAEIARTLTELAQFTRALVYR